VCVLLTLITSCNKEEINQLNESASTSVDSREIETCSNFVLNGDFESLSCTQPPTGWNLFQSGCVDDWECFYHTADVVNDQDNWSNSPTVQTWDNYTFDSNKAFMCSSDANAFHKEGITHELYREINPFCDLACGPRFILQFDYSTTHYPLTNGDNFGLTLSVDLGGEVDILSSNPIDCHNEIIDPIVTYNIAIPNGEALHPFANTFCRYINIDALQSQNQNGLIDRITFEVDSEYEGDSGYNTEGVFIDNVVISCESAFVKGIITDQVVDCTFDFTADLSYDESGSYANVVPGAVVWDFGDGNFDSGYTASHKYDTPGTYTVTMRVSDLYGCCTVKRAIVTCEPEPPCTQYVCWMDLIDLRLVTGITINGVEHNFDNAVIIEGGYFEITFNLFQQIFPDENFTPAEYGIFTESHNEVGCSKVNEDGEEFDVPGFYFTDALLDFENFYGFDENGNQVEIPFNEINCD